MQLTGERVTDALSSVGLVAESGGYLKQALAFSGWASNGYRLSSIHQIAGHLKEGWCGIKIGCPVVVEPWIAGPVCSALVRFHMAKGFQLAGTSEILGLVSEQAHPASGVVTFPAYQGSICTQGQPRRAVMP